MSRSRITFLKKLPPIQHTMSKAEIYISFGNENNKKIISQMSPRYFPFIMYTFCFVSRRRCVTLHVFGGEDKKEKRQNGRTKKMRSVK